MPRLEHSVALIGKLGHGKTRVLNQVCGTHHASKGGTKSVTTTIEYGVSKRHGIFVLGTPGLCPTEDVACHIGAQKLALELTPLSGVYLVLKCGRDGDMIDDQITDIIDMVGEEMVRIIVTHADVEESKDGFNEADVKRSVSRLAGIEVHNIVVVGLNSNPTTIDDFLQRTLLPQPRRIQLQTEQVVKLAVRSRASRNISKSIRDIYDKVAAAKKYCDSDSITNDDLNDLRNNYRACNHCGAIYVKVEGCNGQTVCGSLSLVKDRDHDASPSLTYFGIDWPKTGGGWTLVSRSLTRLWNREQSSARQNLPADMIHRKRNDALIESGCGQSISWSSMRPVDVEQVAILGAVETLKTGTLEDISEKRFHTDLQLQEEVNKSSLQRDMEAEGLQFNG